MGTRPAAGRETTFNEQDRPVSYNDRAVVDSANQPATAAGCKAKPPTGSSTAERFSSTVHY